MPIPSMRSPSPVPPPLAGLPEKAAWMNTVFLWFTGNNFAPAQHCASNSYVRTRRCSRISKSFLAFLKGCLANPDAAARFRQLYDPTVETCVQHPFLFLGLVQLDQSKRSITKSVVLCQDNNFQSLVAVSANGLRKLPTDVFGTVPPECSVCQVNRYAITKRCMFLGSADTNFLKWDFAAPQRVKKARKADDDEDCEEFSEEEEEWQGDEEEGEDDEADEAEPPKGKKGSSSRTGSVKRRGPDCASGCQPGSHGRAGASKRRASGNRSGVLVSEQGCLRGRGDHANVRGATASVPPVPTQAAGPSLPSATQGCDGSAPTAPTPSRAAGPVIPSDNRLREIRKALVAQEPSVSDPASAPEAGTTALAADGSVMGQVSPAAAVEAGGVLPPIPRTGAVPVVSQATQVPGTAAAGSCSSVVPASATPMSGVTGNLCAVRLDAERDRAIRDVNGDRLSTKDFVEDLRKRIVFIQHNHPEDMTSFLDSLGLTVAVVPVPKPAPDPVDQWGGGVPFHVSLVNHFQDIRKMFCEHAKNGTVMDVFPFQPGERLPEVIEALSACKGMTERVLKIVVDGFQDGFLVFLFLSKLKRKEHALPCSNFQDRVWMVLENMKFILALCKEFGGEVLASGSYFDVGVREFRKLEESTGASVELRGRFPDLFREYHDQLGHCLKGLKYPQSFARRFVFNEFFRRHRDYRSWCREVCKLPSVMDWVQRPVNEKSPIDRVFEATFPRPERRALPAAACDEVGIPKDVIESDLVMGPSIPLPILERGGDGQLRSSENTPY